MHARPRLRTHRAASALLPQLRVPAASVAVHAQGGTCIMVGDDRQWIADASKLAVAALGCTAVTEPLFHVPTGGAHDQETFNHEPYDIKCAGGGSAIPRIASFLWVLQYC